MYGASVWFSKNSGTCFNEVEEVNIIHQYSGYQRKSAFLFQKINITRRTVIKSAKIILQALLNSGKNFDYDIKISAMKTHPYHISHEDVNDPSCAFKDSLTETYAVWKGPHKLVSKHTFFETINFKNVVQEIVNLDDWTAGNGIIIVFHNDEMPDFNENITNTYKF